MSDNKQKNDKSTEYGKSKYAIKKQQQASGHYSPTSPFCKPIRQKEDIKQDEVKA